LKQKRRKKQVAELGKTMIGLSASLEAMAKAATEAKRNGDQV
jgi:hypothetical protein